MIGGTRCGRAENELDANVNVHTDARDTGTAELEEECKDEVDETSPGTTAVLGAEGEVEGDAGVEVVGDAKDEVEAGTEVDTKAAIVAADVVVADPEPAADSEPEARSGIIWIGSKLHGFGGAMLAARCLPALPYVLWNGSNDGTVDDDEEEDEDRVETTIGGKWVFEKEKVGDESDPVFIEAAVPSDSAFAAAAVASSVFPSLDSSSFRSTFSSLLGDKDGEAAARGGNTTDGDGLVVVVEMEAGPSAGADEVA